MRALAPALAFLLTGCNSGQIDRCENAVKDRLKAPATYRRIEAEHHATTRLVFLTFDSQNSFSALIRARAICEFSSSGDLISIDMQ